MKDKDLPLQIMEDYKIAGSWGKLAQWPEYLGINKMSLSRYGKGHEVRKNEHREILGLTCRELVYVCSCGKAHTYDCTKQVVRPKKKVTRPTKRVRRQFSVSIKDIDSAAKTIVKNYSSDELDQLEKEIIQQRWELMK